MKSSRLPILPSRILILVLLLAALPPSISAQQCWIAAGATAIPDDGDFSSTAQSGPSITVSATAPLPAVIDSRLSVTGIDLLDPNQQLPKELLLAVRYRDNGNGARVRAFLNEVSLATGLTTEILAFDSDSYPSSNDFQIREVASPTCSVSNVFRSYTSLYFVRLELTKSASDGAAFVQAVRVCVNFC